MREHNQHLEALQDIRQIMQRSSRFLSLSGLSGIAAGFWALVGAYFAFDWIADFYYNHNDYGSLSFQQLKFKLFLLAGAVLGLALVSAFYFTWRKTRRDNVSLWNHTSRQLTINMMIPLMAGGLFLLAMLQHGDWQYIAPGSLVFYGLALVNGSKYTVSDIRYLGVSEIILGLIATQYVGYSLHFWAIGFGVLHIVYGFAMWWKAERKPIVE
jgi:hypothetical protein